MSEKTYSDRLRDPRWQERRLRIFERDDWTCQSCGACKTDGIPLHVHHLKYFPKLKPWEYDHFYLVTYCEKCHETEHLVGALIRMDLISIIEQYRLPIKPFSELCILAEKWPPFMPLLKAFLNDSMIQYLKTKELKAA